MPTWLLIALAFLALFSFSATFVLVPGEAYSEDGSSLGSAERVRRRSRIQVLVLGDIGRSPRMQNHALSLARCGLAVDLIGYTDSDLHPRLLKQRHVTVWPIPRTPKSLQTSNRRYFVLLAPLKVLFQVWSLWTILGHRTQPAKWLLVQNPPSIPTLLVASLICWLRKTRLVIDWHNFGYTILALKLGESHPMVKASKIYEQWLARSASVNFTVSHAMTRMLKKDFGIKAPLLTLYDRPNADFQPLKSEERLQFLKTMELAPNLKSLLLKGKLKVIISSTSWTPDEDFSMLLDALVGYSRLATSSHPQLPELIVIITGRGPQKGHYVKKINALEEQGLLEMVTIKTAWLPTFAYARLLASADLGVSLHQSSSGVDLPMKVVDMFGAGLPVVGYSKFESWPELVKEDVNGRGFEDADGLQTVLVQLLGDGGKRLKKLKAGVLEERKHSWDDEWISTAGRALGYIADKTK